MSAAATRPHTGDEALPLVQRLVSVLWPSFLVAGLGTVVLFTALDPREIGQCLGHQVDRLGAYTVGFFALWALTALSSALTCYFRRPCHTPRETED